MALAFSVLYTYIKLNIVNPTIVINVVFMVIDVLWIQQDLNLQPPDYESVTLTN